jgi:hypothetical protein
VKDQPTRSWFAIDVVLRLLAAAAFAVAIYIAFDTSLLAAVFFGAAITFALLWLAGPLVRIGRRLAIRDRHRA